MGENKDEINIWELIKEQIESIKIDDKSIDTIRADAEKYHTDMVEENKEFIPILEEERKEAVDRARDTLKDEALTKREDDINKYYNAWIEASSKIPTVEEIVKDLEAAQEIQKDFREQALEMIQIAEIEDPEEQDAAVKESMMKKVDLENDPEAEDRIDAMIKQMREVSSNFESKIKQIEEIEPTEEEEKAKEYLSSLFERLIEDVKDVEVEKEESKEVMDNGLNKRLINKADIDYDTNNPIYG